MRSLLRNWWCLLIILAVSGALTAAAAADSKSFPTKEQSGGSWGQDKAISLIRWKLDNGESLSAWEKDQYLQWEQSHRPECSPLDNTGGPDGFGYAFKDNVAPDTATYDWIELRGAADVNWVNSWTAHDDGYCATPFAIGFHFPFYSAAYDSFRLAVNGIISFNTTLNSLGNDCLPSTAAPGPAIFPYWDDLHLDWGGITTGTDVIGFKNFGNYTVIEYDSIGHCCSAGTSLKFEVILFNTGAIKMQYNTLSFGANTNTQSIGIQSNGTAGSPALTYVCNTTGIQPVNGLAIWYFLPNGIPTPVTNLQSSPGPIPITTPTATRSRRTAFSFSAPAPFPIRRSATWRMACRASRPPIRARAITRTMRSPRPARGGAAASMSRRSSAIPLIRTTLKPPMAVGWRTRSGVGAFPPTPLGLPPTVAPPAGAPV
jgi:hypothetical protein